MKFRPCIDIHDGKVKQIVGSSLSDRENTPRENFASDLPAAHFAKLYKSKNLFGAHVIMLNPKTSPLYEETLSEALSALRAFRGGMQLGGGVTDENAAFFLDNGASHVIVTSYVFFDGKLDWGRLDKIRGEVGKDRLVLDLSCRKRGDDYFVVTDRWQKFSDFKVTLSSLEELSGSCAEFLIHAVDVEGKRCGIDETLLKMLSSCAAAAPVTPITYAGGVKSLDDIDTIGKIGDKRIDFTIGSALSLFGGSLEFEDVLRRVNIKIE